MGTPKYIPIKEFREFGFLQEVNRQFLHPLGLALEIRIHEDESEEIVGIWDYREDEEGILFQDLSKEENYTKYNNVQNLRNTKIDTRCKLFGSNVQPIGDRRCNHK